MVMIDLTQGKEAKVDHDVYEQLYPVSWYYHQGYAVTNDYSRGKSRGRTIFMHRVVWELHNGPVLEGMVVDHKNRDKLDNRISNLRCVSKGVDQHNRTLPNITGYKGVKKHGSRWVARIASHYKLIHLGVFDTKEEAARAYDRAAIKLHGNNAATNFPKEQYAHEIHTSEGSGSDQKSTHRD